MPRYWNYSSDSEAINAKLAADVLDFAARIRRIPRKVVRCDVYGTSAVVVDEAHALNIFRKVVCPSVNKVIAYDAISVLRERLAEDSTWEAREEEHRMSHAGY